MFCVFWFFFFTSRGGHRSFACDGSSAVSSSDLGGRRAPRGRGAAVGTEERSLRGHNLAFLCRFFHRREHGRAVRRITAGAGIHPHTATFGGVSPIPPNLKKTRRAPGATPPPPQTLGGPPRLPS